MRNNLLLVIGAGIALSWMSCSGKHTGEEGDQTQPVNVTVAEVGTGAQPFLIASGKVESIETASLSTRIMGRITRINVQAGDAVKKGQVLATISDEDIRAKSAQADAMILEAEAALASVQKDFNRFTNLYQQQSATAKELDNVTLQYESAKARVASARQMKGEIGAMLSYGSIVAPFDGVVTQKLAETGSISVPGMPVLAIERSGILQVAVTVSEADISNLHVGDPVTVQMKSSGISFESSISQVNPSSQFSGGQYAIKVAIPEKQRKDLLPGMFADIKIPSAPKQAAPETLVLPVSALVKRDELTGVYTVSAGNTALLRWIRIGRRTGDQVEVLSGLARGEKYILSATSKLYNGAVVNPR